MAGVDRIDAGAAWAASSVAVTRLLGAAPPTTPGSRRGGRRQDRAASWRRKVAIYTAAVSLGAGIKPLAPHIGVRSSVVRVFIREMENLRDGAGVDQLLEIVKGEAEREMARGVRLAVIT